MRLVRFAVIALTNPPPARVLSARYKSSVGVDVTIGTVHGAESAMEPTDLAAPGNLTVQWASALSPPAIVCAHSSIGGLLPVTGEDGKIEVPEEARQLTEAAIREFADLLALAHQCRRTIRSPYTSVALVPEFEGEFGAASALSIKQRSRPTTARVLPQLCVDKLPDFIWGRINGLMLLANGLSEESPAGRAREYYRLVEAAFGKGIGALKKPLYEFLATSAHPMKYSKRETDGWVGLRGKVMHGDTYAASSRDVQPILGRLEWAAYDLLLHKEHWGTLGVTRRGGLPLMAGPMLDGSIKLFHPAASLQIDFMDPFGAFPLDHSAAVSIAEEGVLTNS